MEQIDYKELYEQAKERAKHNLTYAQVEEIFPEPESEDERIRKDLIIYLRSVLSNKKYGDKFIESWIAWLEKQAEQKPIKEHNICDFCEERYGCVSPCPTKLIEEQKPADFSDLRIWKYIVDAAWTEKEGIGQYLDSPFTEEVAKKLQKRFGKIEQKPAEWSEEDEKMRVAIIFTLAGFTGNEDKIYWLKNLKDRVQPKVELTQLDKNILEAAIAFVAQNNHFNCWRGVDKHTVLSALHSLRHHFYQT